MIEMKTLNIEKDVFKCENCDFRTNSSNGIKTHMKRMQTTTTTTGCHMGIDQKYQLIAQSRWLSWR